MKRAVLCCAASPSAAEMERFRRILALEEIDRAEAKERLRR
jgi:hypothetical protein